MLKTTYITDKLAQSLNLPIVGKDKIVIKTFSDDSPVLHSCNIVQLAVQCLDGEMIYINAYSVPFICSPLSCQRIETAVTNYPHLTGLQLADYSDGPEPLEISILLGSDYYWLFVLGSPVRGERNMGPTALCTKFGYVLNGPVEVTGSGEHSYTNFVETHAMKTASDCLTTEEVNDSLKHFWDYESIGIKKEEPPVYETFLEDIKLDDGRYEVSLPFKDGHPPIPDNYSLSEKRLQSLFARLRSKPKLLSQYDGIIREQLDKGIIERVSQDEIDNAKVNEVHYLPHREVIRFDKSTTKLRIVYDASSKRSEEASLNDCMYTGPPLTPLIFDILLRFRLNGIVLLGDIEKAFLNISIKPEERNLLRLLWVDDASKEEPEIVVYRFTRLVFGLVSSPFVLNATIRSHLSKYAQEDQEFILTVLKSLYVYDFVFSSRSREEAQEVIENAHITYEELETVVIEIEGVLNSRPLAYLYDDISEEPLTPSTLVIGHRLLTQSQFQNVPDLDSSKMSLVKRSKYLKQLLQHFWSRFSKEYLPSLREFHRCRTGSTSRVISIGDVVVINKEKVPRQRWNIGKVVKLIPGKDGVLRAAEAKTLNAAGKQVILKQSIVHLYPMEINDENSNSDAIEEDEPTDINPVEMKR